MRKYFHTIPGRKGILLDRDGTLIKERGSYNYLPEHVEWIPGMQVQLKAWADKGYLLFVVTNQGGIAKGLYDHNHVRLIHGGLQADLQKIDVQIERFLYCPHHPDVSRCLCRKPDSLMPEKLIAAYRLDPSVSWMIGDADRDLDAGKKAGLNVKKV